MPQSVRAQIKKVGSKTYNSGLVSLHMKDTSLGKLLVISMNIPIPKRGNQMPEC